MKSRNWIFVVIFILLFLGAWAGVILGRSKSADTISISDAHIIMVSQRPNQVRYIGMLYGKCICEKTIITYKTLTAVKIAYQKMFSKIEEDNDNCWVPGEEPLWKSYRWYNPLKEVVTKLYFV